MSAGCGPAARWHCLSPAPSAPFWDGPVVGQLPARCLAPLQRFAFPGDGTEPPLASHPQGSYPEPVTGYGHLLATAQLQSLLKYPRSGRRYVASQDSASLRVYTTTGYRPPRDRGTQFQRCVQAHGYYGTHSSQQSRDTACGPPGGSAKDVREGGRPLSRRAHVVVAHKQGQPIPGCPWSCSPPMTLTYPTSSEEMTGNSFAAARPRNSPTVSAASGEPTRSGDPSGSLYRSLAATRT